MPSARPVDSLLCSTAPARLEPLEHRRMLHGGGDGLDPALVEHVRNLVLTNQDSSAYVDTDYDPHKIGVPEDSPRVLDPVQPPPVRSGNGPALPDMFPWLGPNGNNYFENTSLDTISIPGRSLLRFSTAIANGGDGPVELRGGAINPDGTQQVLQRLYDFDPQTRQFTVREDRLAGNFIYHEAHNHLHFEGYAEYKLLQSVNGQPGELATRDDGTQVLGEKVGFCLINIRTFDNSLPGYANSPGGYGCGLRQGISVGWADVYGSSLDSQWVDVTGVEAGDYFLEVTLDANNAIAESDETNNTVRVAVSISETGSTANGTQPDRFDAIEDNGSFETATDLGSLGDRVEASLTLHAAYDQDFYKFTAASTGTVDITLTYQGGDPNLFLYDADQNEIGRSTSNSQAENITVPVVGGATYYLKAENFQYLDEIVDNYALQIDGPIAEVSTSSSRSAVLEGQTFNVTVHRTGPVFEPLIADLTFGGNATFGVDYTVSATTASFGAEAETFDVTITVLNDDVKETTELITVGVAGDASYVASPVQANIMIREGLQVQPTIGPAIPTVGPIRGSLPGGRSLLQAPPTTGPSTGFAIDLFDERRAGATDLDELLASPFSNDRL